MTTALLTLLLLMGQVAPAAPVAPAEDYAVGIGDVLAFRVFGEDDTDRPQLRVDPDGTIEVPHLGRLAVAGKTARQIKELIEAEYIRKDVYRTPSVNVTVTDFKSQVVYVMGPGVKAPNQITVRGVMSVTEAIQQAGWFNSDAGAEVHIMRHRPGDPPNTPLTDRTPDLKVARKDIEEGKALNIRVGGGDTIYVPRADVFYVTGAVKSPGTYTIKPGLTVYQAVYAEAGGLTERGARGRIHILRLVNGKEARIDIKNLNTFIIEPKDTIVVPNRRW
jgi:polysaccharide biosynthesis/export protein